MVVLSIDKEVVVVGKRNTGIKGQTIGTESWDRRSQPKETKPSLLSLRTTHSNGTNCLLPLSFSSLPSSHSLSSSARTHYTKPCQSCDPANNSIQFLGHDAGYYRLPHTVDARMFYFLFESRKSNKSDPVVIWLTGGPGCSSELALFYENGPFHISNNLSLIWNDFGWDQESNLIFVDQPTGTGFSYSFSANDTHHNEESISNDLYDFLQVRTKWSYNSQGHSMVEIIFEGILQATW